MVDPLLDPLDTMPVDRPTPKAAYRYRESTQATGETFGDILSQKIDRQPTPVMTPDALRVPEIKPKPKNNISVAQNNQQVTTNPNQLAASSSDSSNQEVKAQSIVEPSPTPELKPSDILPINLLDILNLQIDNKKPEEPKASKSQVTPEKTAVADALDVKVEQPKTEIVDRQAPSQAITNQETVKQELARQEIVKQETSQHDSTYIIQSGDTLSHIVSSSLRESGQEYSTRDVYQLVNMIAAHNEIDNPDRIYAGNQIDLEPLYSGQFIAQETKPQHTAMAGELQSPVKGYITSGFGLRNHPISKQEHFHNGIDIGVPTGTPVTPVQSGQVVFSGEKGGYGQVVEIDHNNGMRSVYGHLSDLMVKTGDRIEANDVIALSGNTGRTTGPHLHLEIHRDGRVIDPLTVISRNEIENTPRQIARGDIR